MKCLVFSDSHGRVDGMLHALSRHRDAEAVFFLGDGLSDLNEVRLAFPAPTYFAVRGNCDLAAFFDGRRVEKLDRVTLMGKRIGFTHGDLFGVKHSMEPLYHHARETGADILLFGHTHRALEEYRAAPTPVHLFNPGSIGMGEPRTFGIMTLTEQGVLFSHGVARF